jgi:prevent-host-death family protein
MHITCFGGGAMATIRPSSDLRNKYNEISEFCRTYNEPVFITKNGAGDLVVLSNAEFERLTGKYELNRLLEEGFASMRTGRGRPASEVFDSLEKEFGLSDAF